MSSLEQLQRKLDKVPGKEKTTQEEEFGPIQSAKTVKENKEELNKKIRQARESLGL